MKPSYVTIQMKSMEHFRVVMFAMLLSVVQTSIKKNQQSGHDTVAKRNLFKFFVQEGSVAYG